MTAGVALVGAVCATVLIRRKDFHRPDAAAPAAAGRTTETVLTEMPAGTRPFSKLGLAPSDAVRRRAPAVLRYLES